MEKRVAITSRDNPKLKFARRVRDGKAPREFVLVEGLRLASDVIEAGIEIHAAFIDPAAAAHSEYSALFRELEEKGIPAHEVTSDLLRTICDTAHPQGVVLIVNRPVSSIDSFLQIDFLKALSPAIYFAGVNNPLNLGAAIRSAAAAGCPGVFVSPGSCDAFSPKANRAAMGANFRVPVVENAQLKEVMEFAASADGRIVAAVVGGGAEYASVDWKAVGLTVFGSEAHGLDEELLRSVPEKFTIPMSNGVESLNLAVTAAVVAFEARRQRHGIAG